MLLSSVLSVQEEKHVTKSTNDFFNYLVCEFKMSITCVCGSIIKPSSYSGHMKSKKHHTFVVRNTRLVIDDPEEIDVSRAPFEQVTDQVLLRILYGMRQLHIVSMYRVCKRFTSFLNTHEAEVSKHMHYFKFSSNKSIQRSQLTIREYFQGEENGIYELYDPSPSLSPVLIVSGRYQNNQKIGRWTKYTNGGAIYSQTIYQGIKKPLTAYMRFGEQIRRCNKEKMPGILEIARMWRALSDEEKAPYRIAYQIEMGKNGKATEKVHVSQYVNESDNSLLAYARSLGYTIDTIQHLQKALQP